MKRNHRLLAVTFVLGVLAGAAHAKGFDPRGLARYDVSYARCETSFPDMKGHRDEAYLSLWRVKLDTKSAARLADIRKGAAYKAEQKLASQEAAKASDPAAVKALERQCKGLWGELERMPKPAS